MATAQKIIERGLKEIGVGAAGEPIDGEDLFYGLECLNDLIDSMKAVRLMIFEVRRRTFPLTATTASYTIGPTGTWSISSGRPEAIIRAGFVNTAVNPSSPLETPIHVYTDEEWASIGLKTLTSTVMWGLWYQTGVPNGTVFVYPILSVTGTIALYVSEPLSEVAEDENGLATEIVVPPGYRKMFKSHLALEMCDAFGIAPSENLIKRANDSMRMVQKANIKPALLRLPRGLSTRRKRGYNLLTNQ